MNEAVIVSAVRTAVGKAPNGSLRGTRPDELAAVVIREALNRAPGIEAADVDDVMLGCVMQNLDAERVPPDRTSCDWCHAGTVEIVRKLEANPGERPALSFRSKYS